MPTSEEILLGLSRITNTFTWMAILWHIFFYLLIAALILNWKPTQRFFSSLLGLPLISVSIFAWITGNPFNGFIFALFGILLIVFGLKNEEDPIIPHHTWSTVFGIIIIIFGLLYPHFLDTDNYFEYLYSAPTGLIPCPTLSIVIGFAILYNGFQSRRWTWILVIPGLLYGIIGAFRLQVYLDMVLLLATIVLTFIAFQMPVLELRKGE
jgi:hypothetical protein